MSEKLSNLPALPTPITTGDNLYVIRGGVSYKADSADIPSGGGGTVDSVVGGTNITVDSSDAANPIVNLDGSLSPTTTLGDIIFNGGAGDVRYGIGTVGQVLTSDGSVPQWETPTTGGTVTSVAVSGSDGIEVDSGSPITTSGTIALGLNKATLLTFLGITDDYHLSFAFGGEDEDLAVATGAITFQMPNFATTLTGVSVNVKTAPTGTAATFDLNEGGTSVLSTKITIDATETTSETALVQPVISDSAIAANAIMTLDIDAIGTTIAGAGGKAWIYYKRA